MKLMIPAMTLVTAAGVAMAGNSYSGGGGAFPDGGGPGDPFSSTITVGDSFSIADATLDLNGMTHTFVGDLIISLEHVASGTVVTLVDRPGVPDFSGFGWAYNLDGDYTFSDDGAVTWQDVNGGVQDTAFNIASGEYLGEAALAAFDGLDSAGDWTLTISDNAGFDTGALTSWDLNLAPVPTPGAIAVMGLGGLVAARRRRA